MKKLYGILFAVIILVSTVGTKIWTYANDNEEALVTDEQEVREFVSTYFDLVDKSMAELKIYPELEDFF